MKLFSTLILLLTSSLALATPAIGDMAAFNLKMEQNGAYMLGQYEVSLFGVEADGKYKMRTVVTMEDSPAQSSESAVEASGFLSDAAIQDALANCAGYGGTSSEYTIVGETSSETVPTCIIPFSDENGQPSGEAHIAQVALGVVKQIQIDQATGRTITLEMKSYANGGK